MTDRMEEARRRLSGIIDEIRKNDINRGSELALLLIANGYNEALDNLIAAVRAEKQVDCQEMNESYMEEVAENERLRAEQPRFCDQHTDEETLSKIFGILCPACMRLAIQAEAKAEQPAAQKCIQDTCAGVAQWCDTCAKEPTFKQPAAVGHVANCNCKRPVDKHGEIATDCRYTDPRCKPGLLREAEVRLEAMESCSGATVNELSGDIHDARAEVERLRKGEK